MLRVEDRVAKLRLNHVFNICQGNTSAYLNNHFILNNNITKSAINKNLCR